MKRSVDGASLACTRVGLTSQLHPLQGVPPLDYRRQERRNTIEAIAESHCNAQEGNKHLWIDKVTRIAL